MALQLFKIASTTVETPQTSVTFSSIPQGYTDLKLVYSARTNDSTSYDYAVIEFNNDTTSTNYDFRYLYGNGAVGSGSGNVKFGGYASANGATTNTFSNSEIYIPNYTGSAQKSYSTDSIAESNSSTNGNYILAIHAGKWSNTAAITSITFKCSSGPLFLANSTFTIYGVL